MSDNDKSAWDKLIGQVSSPWDWFAIGAGAAAGAGVTIATQGADLGTSIAAGATTGLTARKALVASLQRPGLQRRARELRDLITNLPSTLPPTSPVTNREALLKSLDTEIDLWKRKVTPDNEFTKRLDELVEKYRTLRNA